MAEWGLGHLEAEQNVIPWKVHGQVRLRQKGKLGVEADWHHIYSTDINADILDFKCWQI